MGDIAESLKQIAETLPLDPKKLTGKQGGVEGWYPYYAGFSELFAKTVLENCGLPRGSSVLDPWNGSGTTTYVADKLGFRGIGFDINPVASLVANAKLARPKDAQHVLGMARRISQHSLHESRNVHCKVDSLLEWLMPAVVSQYRKIEAEVIADLGTNRSGSAVNLVRGDVPPLASFLILALMRAARSLASLRPTSNPTWIQPGERTRANKLTLTKRWIETIERMAEDLSFVAEESVTASESRIADARKLPLKDSSIDLVLTSPPYCTRIDYVVNTAFELAALGVTRDSTTFTDLRRGCMGTPLARQGLPTDPSSEWPTRLRELLENIRRHPSKASNSYYYKTFHQYFQDCDTSLGEIRRCLKPRMGAVIVVQSSYYKDIYVNLAELYSDLARTRGFEPCIISEIPVRRVLSRINSRSSRHRESTSYLESVLVIERTL